MTATYDFYHIESLVDHLAAGRPVLTPNHRLARHMKLAWGRYQSARGATCWATPRVMSLDHWWRHCYEKQRLAGAELPGILSASRERALWLSCVRDSGALLLRPQSAADLARDAYQNLLLWEVDWSSPDIAQQFGFVEDGRMFLDWARRFDAELARLDLAPLARLIPALAGGQQEETLVLAEFGDLPPLQQTALSLQCGDLVRHRAGDKAAACVLQPCDSHQAELQAAVQWAAERYKQDSSQRIGILLPGLVQERPHLERLLQQAFESDPRQPDTLPVNFSAGFPLARFFRGVRRATLLLWHNWQHGQNLSR